MGGVLFGSRAALAVFRRQRCGTLINVSSMLGLTPNPLVPAYVMSKFAVRGLSLSLRQATKAEPGIHVCVVLPGSIDTPLFERAANHTGRRLRAIPPAMAPERVAAAIVSCARKPRRQVPVGGVARLLVLGHRLAPRLVEAVVASTSTRLLVRREQAPATSGALFSPPKEGRVHGGWRRGRLRRHIGKCVGRRQARA